MASYFGSMIPEKDPRVKRNSAAINPFTGNQMAQGVMTDQYNGSPVAQTSSGGRALNPFQDTIDAANAKVTNAVSPIVSQMNQLKANETEKNMGLSKEGIGETTNAQISEDLMTPGAYETWADKNENVFDNPFAGEQAMTDALGGYKSYGDNTLSAQQYADSKANRPVLAEDAGVGAGYDIARNNAIRDIKAASAAGGMLGSTYMLGQVGQTTEKLNAQQQADEANYRMQVAQEGRMYNDMLGGQASQADTQKGNWFTNMSNGATALDNTTKGRIGASGEVALTAQNAKQDRLTKAGSAGTASQNAREGRIGGALNEAAKAAGVSSDVLNTINQLMISGDSDLMNMAIEGNLAGVKNALASSNLSVADQTAAIELIASVASGFINPKTGAK